ncbi:MAG: hypothetical protein M1831_003377 [Alyxoria varia]|nr:MAG: hypothetical protein M1831_003377 [Alyxoria varia]
MASSGADTPLTTREALSGISGSISLATSIFVFVPQLYENYTQKSAAGVSIPFILIWLVGDILNFGGAVWARLIPIIITLGGYFVLSEIVLLLQCFYYNHWMKRPQDSGAEEGNPHTHQHSQSFAAVVEGLGLQREESHNTAGTQTTFSEEEPLLTRSDSVNFHATDRGRSRRKRRKSSMVAPYGAIVREENPGLAGKRTTATLWVKNTISIFVICIAGAVGWVLAWQGNVWQPTPLPPSGGEYEDDGTPYGAEVMGYLSALCYLGARIPQIIKNWREQSCEGLSLLFFLLSLLGNLTYGAGVGLCKPTSRMQRLIANDILQILLHSLDRQYVITNTPWLIGSLGTMFQDAFIFIQFHIYGDKGKEEDALSS